MRKRKTKGKANKNAMVQVGRLYGKLRWLCKSHVPAPYAPLFDDMFHDTILYVIHDKSASKKEADSSMEKHFINRFRLIAFQTIKDIQELKEKSYADYKQAQKEGE
jgi:hypothetical protein